MSKTQIEQILTGTLLREGAGVKLFRYIGADKRNDFDPFLLFDFFDSNDPMDYIGGFPEHPHRGFETVTYLLHGKMVHHDNQGHVGIIGPGDVQWMTAGRGIIHSEMPQTSGHLCGMQLWLNLPATHKLTTPFYQEFISEELPRERNQDGTIIKVIAGISPVDDKPSPIQNKHTDPFFFDITLPTSNTFEYSLPATHRCILFVLKGSLEVHTETGTQCINKKEMAILGTGEELAFKAMENLTQCLLIGAKKLHEPVVRLGPFVMNTQEEVLQALDDYRNMRF